MIKKVATCSGLVGSIKEWRNGADLLACLCLSWTWQSLMACYSRSVYLLFVNQSVSVSSCPCMNACHGLCNNIP